MYRLVIFCLATRMSPTSSRFHDNPYSNINADYFENSHRFDQINNEYDKAISNPNSAFFDTDGEMHNNGDLGYIIDNVPGTNGNNKGSSNNNKLDKNTIDGVSNEYYEEMRKKWITDLFNKPAATTSEAPIMNATDNKTVTSDLTVLPPKVSVNASGNDKRQLIDIVTESNEKIMDVLNRMTNILQEINSNLILKNEVRPLKRRNSYSYPNERNYRFKRDTNNLSNRNITEVQPLSVKVLNTNETATHVPISRSNDSVRTVIDTASRINDAVTVDANETVTIINDTVTRSVGANDTASGVNDMVTNDNLRTNNDTNDDDFLTTNDTREEAPPCLSGRRSLVETSTSTDVKQKLLVYLEATFQEIMNKMIPIAKIRNKYMDNDLYRIGYVIANVDTLNANIRNLKYNMDKNKDSWNDKSIIDLFDKLLASNKVISGLLETLYTYESKNSEIDEISRLSQLSQVEDQLDGAITQPNEMAQLII